MKGNQRKRLLIWASGVAGSTVCNTQSIFVSGSDLIIIGGSTRSKNTPVQSINREPFGTENRKRGT